MFKFTLSSKYRQKGLSPDAILPEMRNRFDAIWDIDYLDRKVQVRLDEKVVRFFYYIDDVNVDLLIEEKYKEIASISLSSVKETGHDILFFRQQVRNKIDVFINSFWDSCYILGAFPFTGINSAYAPMIFKIFEGFPFIDLNSLEEDGINYFVNNFVFFMQICFLFFIQEIEDRRSDLAQSPHYKKVRDKLRESLVYQLLYSKLKYTIRFYEDAPLLNQADYTLVTRKYTDLLIDPRINKLIAPYNYPVKGKNHSSFNQDFDKQLWFYDPEEELEAILEKNRRQENLQEEFKSNALKRIEENTSCDISSYQLCLEESLVLKIRDFLYTKHAVSHAMTRNFSKKLFWWAQVLMFITSMAILISSILDEKAIFIMHKIFPCVVLLFCIALSFHFLFCFYEKKVNIMRLINNNRWFILLPLFLLVVFSIGLIFSNIFTIFFYGIVAGSVLIWIGRSGYLNGTGENKINGLLLALFPRIIVAELAAWLTIGFSEDLVKSMLWVEGSGIKIGSTILVLAIVVAILYGETKQLSPYKRPNKLLTRVFPILNHAVFFALIIGVVIQYLFYENHIKNSDVMPNVVFNDYFDKANLYSQLLLDLENGQKQYQDYCLLTDLKDIRVRGSANNTQTIIKNDSIEIQATIVVRQQVSNESPKDEIDKHNNIVHYYNHAVNEINIFYRSHVDSTKVAWIGDTLCVLDAINNANNDSIKNENSEKLNSLPIDLRQEISCARINALKFNNSDTLMNWASLYYPELPQTGSNRLDSLTVDAIRNHKCCRYVGIHNKKIINRLSSLSFFKDKKMHWCFFPTLLVLHTLIVLVLAFVIQLFITQKSMTEPL